MPFYYELLCIPQIFVIKFNLTESINFFNYRLYNNLIQWNYGYNKYTLFIRVFNN